MNNDVVILGFHASFHGVTGTVCKNNKFVVSINLERITREKNDVLLPFTFKEMCIMDLERFYLNDYYNIPVNKDKNVLVPPSLEGNKKFEEFVWYLLDAAKIKFDDINYISLGMRLWDRFKEYFKKRNPNIKFFIPSHHYAHACQAYYASPFNNAGIMVLDGWGLEFNRSDKKNLSGCIAYGDYKKITLMNDLPFKSSLGSLYTAATILSGFKFNEEGKTMGLAPYGSQMLYNIVNDEIKYDMYKDNIAALDMFGHYILTSPKELLYSLGNWKRITKFAESKNFKKDVAFMAQQVVEDVMVYLGKYINEKIKTDNLCIAGGVGLNCVANYKVYKNTNFKNIFTFPSAGDNGLSMGGVYTFTNLIGSNIEPIENDYLGKEYTKKEIGNDIEKYINDNRFKITEYHNFNKLYDRTAKAISNGKIIGWWQGRSEFGPRSLGNRSILADPRRSDMKDILNDKVKHRESFRPFSPSILFERVSEFFDLDIESPYMLLAPPVREGKEKLIPAVVHIDKTSRVQTVTKKNNLIYYNLIKAFERITNIPLLLNTSFNVAGEPIVESPEDAIKCFLNTEIDILVIDNIMMMKENG